MDIRLSNEARVATLVVRTSYFVLPNRLILKLYNCHFVPVFEDIIFILFSITLI
jgi:hypothetical protein